MIKFFGICMQQVAEALKRYISGVTPGGRTGRRHFCFRSRKRSTQGQAKKT